MIEDKALIMLRDDIEILIPFAVPKEELQLAMNFLDSYAEDSFALAVIKDYYQTLPNAREEALVKISVLEVKEQVFLLLLSSTRHHYFYVTNDEESLFLGEWHEGIEDKQLLMFFGYVDSETFAKAHPEVMACRQYISLERMNEELCPSCGAYTGEFHTLGCPVEVCPWCGGQLNHCNCRFEQMGVEELTDESILDEFVEKLEQKGRVPYTKEQRPSFMVEKSVTLV
jgi:hypothetical protein